MPYNHDDLPSVWEMIYFMGGNEDGFDEFKSCIENPEVVTATDYLESLREG